MAIPLRDEHFPRWNQMKILALRLTDEVLNKSAQA
jgi:hypothetical protein